MLYKTHYHNPLSPFITSISDVIIAIITIITKHVHTSTFVCRYHFIAISLYHTLL